MEMERRIRFFLRVLRVLIDVLEFELNTRIEERHRSYYETVNEEPFEGEDDYFNR